MSKLQKKPAAHKRGHPTLQNMNFKIFFLLLWVIFALLDPDPDSGFGSGSTGPIESGSGSETLLSTLMTLSLCCSYPSRAGGLPGRGAPEGGTEALSTLMTLSLCCSYSSRAGGLPGRGAPEGGTEALSTLMILSLCCSHSSRAGGLPGRGAPEGGTEALSTLMILSLCCSHSSRAGGLPGRGAPEGWTLPGIRGPLAGAEQMQLLPASSHLSDSQGEIPQSQACAEHLIVNCRFFLLFSCYNYVIWNGKRSKCIPGTEVGAAYFVLLSVPAIVFQIHIH